jgi:hypothetical protein
MAELTLASEAAVPRQQPLMQGMRITVKGFTMAPGDAVITSVNRDGSLAVRYDHGGTWSRVCAADATLYKGPPRPEFFKKLDSKEAQAVATEAAANGICFQPSSRYEAGVAKRKLCKHL